MDQVTQLASSMSFMPLYVVRAAVTLGLPEALVEPALVEDVAARLSTDPRATEALVDHLLLLGLVERDVQRRVSLSEVGRVLLREHPAGLARAWDMSSVAYRMEQAYARLPEVIRTGEASYDDVFGRPLYEDIELHDHYIDEVVDSARGLLEHSAERLVEWLALPRRSTLVDIGAGSGVHLARFLDSDASMAGIAVDLPGTLQRTSRHLADHGVAGRVTFVPGDFFECQLASADTYLLSNVLVDLNDRMAVQLLERVRNAAPDGSRVVLLELDRGSTDPGVASHMSIHQLCMTGGRLRMYDELVAVGVEAGLEFVRSTDFGAGVTAIVFGCPRTE
jgi:ubiquinone/menaquinone biosynthesis C-methylase UbiE